MAGFYFILLFLLAPYIFLSSLCMPVFCVRNLGINLQAILLKSLQCNAFLPSGRLFGPVFAFMTTWKLAEILKRKYERIYFALSVGFKLWLTKP